MIVFSFKLIEYYYSTNDNTRREYRVNFIHEYLNLKLFASNFNILPALFWTINEFHSVYIINESFQNPFT